MSSKTPSVVDGALCEYSAARSISLDSPAWFAWLADDAHNVFHFDHPSGGFTARKERKQRGQWYWVAYRQVQNKLHKTYLGKSDALTASRLRYASEVLERAASET